MLTETQKSLALQLFDVGAIKFGAFKLKLHEVKPGAPLSPIYIDLRIVRSFPEVISSVVEVYEGLMQGVRFDLYADVPTAVTPFVAILSYKTRIPMISPRIVEKEHGTKHRIDGIFEAGQVALLIDDLITKADSKLKAISILEDNGLRVYDVIVLIDREQGGSQELKKLGYACRSAFKLKKLLNFYSESEKISQEQYVKTVTYLETF